MNLEYQIDTKNIANFIVFPVDTTNIFPLANSHAGGQLVTEFNLRCRDMVTTKSTIDYHVGPSYVHGQHDFHVKAGIDKATSSTVLEISPGTAIVNGHYLESFTDIFIDLAQLNSERISNGLSPYTGKLAVGLRAMYSTDATLSGSMMVEHTNEAGIDMYMGIQVILGPQDAMYTPEEAGSDQSLMTYHLKLATFSFYNGSIRNIINVHEKFEWLEAERIGNIDDLLSDNYISKRGLDPHKLYTYATKNDPNSTKRLDTWCDATKSSFILDNAPSVSEIKPSDESRFEYDSSTGETRLRLAHMQVDGMTDGFGTPTYYDDKLISLPKANFGMNTGGTVDALYTLNIKKISQRLEQYYHLAAGKQVHYLSMNSSEFDGVANFKINPNWRPGDYILVGQDFTLSNFGTDTRAPSSFYAVLPGYVTEYIFYAVSEENSNDIPKNLTGVELEEIVVSDLPRSEVEVKDKTLTIGIGDTAKIGLNPIVPGKTVDITVKYRIATADGEEEKTATYTLDSEVIDYNTGIIDVSKITDKFLKNQLILDNISVSYHYLASNLDGIIEDFTHYRGVPGEDYFTVTYNYKNDNGDDYFRKYYYVVKSATPYEWSEGMLLTRDFGLATTETIGGFKNVDDSYLDGGYVILNEEGHLQLIDYALLRSGVLAYQLGENLTLPTGIETEEVQTYLDEYINQRVAFPNINQIANADNPNIIDVYVDLAAEETATTVNIYDIDSRFNTSIYIHITGSVNNNTTINILDCQKIRLDLSTVISRLESEGTEDGPIINIYRSNIYYDAGIFDYILGHRSSGDELINFTGMQDITLWYQRYSDKDPKLFVDGMTVRRLGDNTSNLIATGNVVAWNENNKKNDFHYSLGLHGITFSGYGQVVGMSIFIKNGSTANIEGEYRSIIYQDLAFPNGDDFKYPIRCFEWPIKVTGEFITSYQDIVPNWIIQDSKFSLFMKKYDPNDEAKAIRASISVFEQSHIIPCDLREQIDGMTMDPWSSDNPHVFFGSIFK